MEEALQQGGPPSPARSIASVASTAFSEKRCTCHTFLQRRPLPSVITSKSKEELQVFAVDLIKKLRLRDKKLEELTAAAQKGKDGQSSSSVPEGGKSPADLERICRQYKAAAQEARSQLEASKQELAAMTDRAQAAEQSATAANEQLHGMVQSSKDSALAFETRLLGLQQQLQDEQAARQEAEQKLAAAQQEANRKAGEQQEVDAALQQQLHSLKDALKTLSQEREDIFLKLGEHKEAEAELKEQLKQAQLELDVRSQQLQQLQSQVEGQRQQLQACQAEQADPSPGAAQQAQAQQLAEQNDQEMAKLQDEHAQKVAGLAAEHQQQLAALWQTINELQAELAVHNDTHTVLSQQSQEPQADEAGLKQEVQQLQGQLCALQEHEQQLQVQLERSQVQVQELQATLISTEEQLRRLQADLDVSSSSAVLVQQLQAELSSSQEQLQRLQTQLDAHEQQAQQQQQPESSMAPAHMQTPTDAAVVQQTAFSEHQADGGAFEQPPASQQPNSVMDVTAGSAQPIRTASEDQPANDGWEGEALDLQGHMQQQQGSNSEAETDVDDKLKGRVQELEQAQERLHDMHDQLSSELATRHAQLAERERQVASMTHQLQALQAELEAADERAAGSQQQLERLQMQGESSNRQVASQLYDDNEQDELVQQLQSQLDNSQQQLQKLQEQKQEADTVCELLRTQLSELQAQNDALSAALELAKQSVQSDVLQQQGLNSDAAEVQRQQSIMTQMAEQLTQDAMQASQQVQDLAQQLSDANTTLEAAEARHDQVVAEWQAAVGSLTALQAEYEEAKRQQEETQGSLISLQQQYEAAAAELQAVTSSLAMLQAQHQQLQADKTALQELYDAAVMQLQQAATKQQEPLPSTERGASTVSLSEAGEAAASAATGTAESGATTQPAATLQDAQELLARQLEEARKEVADNKKRFVAMAKKKSAEHAAALKALEAEVAALKEQVSEVEALRKLVAARERELADAQQAAEAVQLATEHARSRSIPEAEVLAERAETSRLLAAKDRDLQAAQSLLAEYKSLSVQRESGAAASISRLEEALKNAAVERELAISKVESQLHDREVQVESLQQQLNAAEAALADAQRTSADAASGVMAELAAARADAETAKAEAQATRRELETEKGRLTKAVDELKKRLARSTKMQHAAEVAAAEARGKSESERERHALEVALAQQATDAMKSNLERVDAELRDYKSRAQALLRVKDLEIKALKDDAAARPPVDMQQLQQLQTALMEKQQALAVAEESLATSQQTADQKAAEAAAEHEAQVKGLQARIDLFQAAALESGREVDDLRHRCEVLEARLAYHQNNTDHEAALQVQKELQQKVTDMEAQVARLHAAAVAAKEAHDHLVEAKDEEVLQLVRKFTLAQEEINVLKQQLAMAHSTVASPITPSSPTHHSRASSLPNNGNNNNNMTGLSSTQYSAAGVPVGGTRSYAGDAVAVPLQEPLTPKGSQQDVAALQQAAAATDDAVTAPVFGSATGLVGGLHRPGVTSVSSAADILGSLIQAESAKQLLADASILDDDGLPVGLSETTRTMVPDNIPATQSLNVSNAGAGNQPLRPRMSGFGAETATAAAAQAAQAAAEKELQRCQAEVDQLLAQLGKTLQRVRELEGEVAELEKEVLLREEMEVALKENLREAERTMQRQVRGQSHVDAEYLKNTVLKMYRTGEAEALLPVFATILSFSPEELRSCREGLRRIQQGDVPLPTAAAVVDSSLNVISSLTSWTSWALGATAAAAPSTTQPTLSLSPRASSSSRPSMERPRSDSRSEDRRVWGSGGLTPAASASPRGLSPQPSGPLPLPPSTSARDGT